MAPMNVEAEKPVESSHPFGKDRVNSIFHPLHKRLNISVDFNSDHPDGLEFWNKLEADLIQALNISSIEEVEQGRKNLLLALERLIKEQKISLNSSDLSKLIDELFAHYFGLGVLESLLNDDSISEIMINDFQEIYLEQKGRLIRSDFSFWSDAHLKHVIDRFCIRNEISLPSNTNPVTTFSLKDNSVATIVFPPVTSNSPSLTIRRFGKNPITIEQFIQFGVISVEMLDFLKFAIEARLNILVCGHVASGANTLANILSSFVPGDERVISIEYEHQFSLRVNHLLKLKATDDQTSEYSYRKLLALAGRMRPDRLVFGEFSPHEAYDALKMIADHYPGSILKMAAKSPADAVNRVETLIQLDKPSLPPTKIRELISSSINLIIYQERLRDGTRAVKSIVEVFEELDSNDQVALKEIFAIEQTGIEAGRIIREFVSFGPPSERLLEKFETVGIRLPSSLFTARARADKARKLSEPEKRAIKFSKGNYVFISYSRDDVKQVSALARELEKNGFYVWLDIWDIKPGEDWGKNLEKAIKNAGVFVVILTHSSAESQFVRNEINLAIDKRLPIIPIKMAECDIPIQLRALQFVLYNKRDMNATVNLISDGLSRYISNKQLVGEI